MVDIRERLRRASEYVSPPEPAYDRLLRRRAQHARNQRLLSASFALVLSAGLLMGMFALLGRLGSTGRSDETTVPGAARLEEQLALGRNDYFYERTVRILPDGHGIEGGTVIIETWWSPDGSGRKAAESTTSSYGPGPTGTWGPGGFPVMEEDLAGLSTDPDELAIQLRQRSGPEGASPQPSITPGPGQNKESGALWRAASDLLEMPNAVPELRAALFQVTSRIPGVTVMTNTPDPVGRPAISLAFQSEGADREMFFDPETLQYMGGIENYGEQGSSYAIVDRAGIVDSIHERPQGVELFFGPPATNLPGATMN